jgi:type VI secretion system protein ImpK
MDRIQAATQYCFGAITQIRRLDASSLPAPELLQQRLCGFIEEMEAQLKESGFNNQDVEDIKYAVVALADEVALNSGEPISSYWMTNLLQFKYFRTNTAGEGFFERLEPLRRDTHRHEVLKLYTLCLLFGFQGKYRIRGGELELMTLTDSLQREVMRPKVDVDMLSPHAARPTEAIAGVKHQVPLLIGAIAAVVLALSFYGVLRWVLSSSVSSLRDEVTASQPKGG